jgi:hypothetical protein
MEDESNKEDESDGSESREANDKSSQPDVDWERLSSEERREAEALLNRYAEIFSIDLKNPGVASMVSHSINTGSSQPVRSAPYRVSMSERARISNLVGDMLANKVVRPSISAWASPVVLVSKKDGSVRFCVDYRKLNGVTIRDAYPLTRIDDALAAFNGSEYFSTFDCCSGYWQIPMTEADREKTAFITPDGLFEFNVMPFGLTNAPATFQRFIDAVLAGYHWKFLIVYLDDIIVFSRTFRQHLKDLSQVFERLKQANVKLKASKCHLFKKELVYLGHLVSREGIRPDPRKIEALEKMPIPSSVPQLRAFVGFCGFYHKFIKNFAILCAPLYALTKLNARFIWEGKHQLAVEAIKRALCTFTLLYHPNYSLTFVIRTDACDFGLGAVLAQIVEGQERVVQFASRTLQPAEKKWCIREKEALAIIWACETFRVYVHGTRFTVETDHSSLQWLLGAKEPPRLVRWALRLSEFNIDIKYRKGSANQVADALSRMPIEGPVPADEERFESLLPARVQIFGELKLNNTEIEKAQFEDPELNPIIDLCRKNAGKFGAFELVEDLLFKNDNGKKLLMVPFSLVEQVLGIYHNETMSAHLSRDRMLSLLKVRFFWPRMNADITDWVAACLTCTKVKPPRALRNGLLVPVVSAHPFEKVGLDIAGPIHVSKGGNRYILVCIDYFTSWVEAAPMKSITADEVIRTFFSMVISRHGCPKVVITDQGTQFTSKAFSTLCDQFQIKSELASAYHQQSNGKVERFIGFLKKTLATITKADQSNWDQLLDHCLLAYRASLNRMLNDTPFFLIYGRDAVLPQDMFIKHHNGRSVPLSGDDPELSIYKVKLTETLRLAYEVLNAKKTEEQARYKDYYDLTHKEINFVNGQEVMLFVPAVKPGYTAKLLASWEGPFKVIGKINSVTYRVVNQSKIVSAHVQRLRPYRRWCRKVIAAQ